MKPFVYLPYTTVEIVTSPHCWLPMGISTRLNPDPIVTATVEIRFEAAHESEVWMGRATFLLLQKLPHVQVADFPAQAKQAEPEAFGHFPELVFKSEAFTVGIGSRSILFEVNNEYPGWPVYFPFIQEVISDLKDELGNATVKRCGVRYASIFPGFFHMSDALVFKIEDGLSGYRRVNDFVRTTFIKENGVQLFLQIGENVQAHQKGRGVRSGLYLDIDASQEMALPAWGPDLLGLIDTLHTEEKTLFENIMLPEVLQQFA